ncbi:NfeD family protein [Tsukamurella sp. 8F]|uniref:NfeD family protein n=1 Tax=unclassified Tsukamurella TaxID=2633480 RepID=UPI0023B9AC45|nr:MULTISPECIES: NfeD family protein [unclassified Tsukamurella]MDF0529264.1 NfeD family protein [Tsukamurella sp. 8J]MDF0586899.1 NfeD family protein [Tsukamurella sp. 8F]
MAAAIWLIAAIVLAAAEAVAGDFVLLMLGGGALATAGATYALGLPPWAQGIVFALASLLLVLGVRPPLKRFALRNQPESASYLQSLPGRTVTVIAPVDHAAGRVRIGADEWSARTPYESVPIPVGAEVTVLEIDGAVAVVVEA